MINKAWVFLFIEALFGVFLLVHVIYYYRFRSHPVFHCFDWETISGQNAILSSVLEPCPQGIGQGGFHCYQYCITIMIVLYCSYFILFGDRNVNIQQQTPSLTSKSDEEKHTVQLCTLGEVSHRCYICLYSVPNNTARTTGCADHFTFPRPYKLLLSSTTVHSGQSLG